MAPVTIPSTQASLAPPELTDTSIIRVRDIITQIKVLTSRIVELQCAPNLSEERSLQLATDKKKLSTQIIILRGFNREMYFQNRAVKNATADSKAQVDSLYLNLQNMKYEQQHLRSEIQDCRNYAYANPSSDLS
jgi:CRISPR/Cas system-associated protein Csx1